MQLVTLYFIPALVAFFWPVVMIISKKKLITAQWLFSISQMILGFAIVLYDVYYGDIIMHSYVADVLYTLVSIFVVPAFYMFVCSLTEPGGITISHRRVFIPSIIYAVMFVAIVLSMGNRRYEMYMNNVIDLGNFSLMPSDAYTLMVIVGYYGFRIFIFLQFVLLLIHASKRLHKYGQMINHPHRRRLEKGIILSFVILFLIALYIAIFPRRMSYDIQIGSIVIVVISSLFIFILGLWAYNLKYSAAQITMMKENQDKNQENY